ncbi:MAG: queuosine precursor transporter [Methanobrevibacter sp.]|jgi:uncharacterized integral membrane protein (TIGR00697 family)|nr:queuosine precursor transporter [Candidatus Methanoflexus mossambicus]
MGFIENKKSLAIFLVAISSLALFVANICVSKVFNVYFLTITLAMFCYPIVYIIDDVMAEFFSFKDGLKLELITYGIVCFISIFFYLGTFLPSTNVQMDSAFNVMFSITPAIFLASFIAFVCGIAGNLTIFKWIKQKNNSLFVRALSSTIVGEFLDSFLFYALAFFIFTNIYDIWTVLSLAISGVIVKTLVEVVLYPLTKKLINYLHKSFNEDLAVL